MSILKAKKRDKKRVLFVGGTGQFANIFFRDATSKTYDLVSVSRRPELYKQERLGGRNIEYIAGDFLEDSGTLLDKILKGGPIDVVVFAAVDYNFIELDRLGADDLEKEFKLAVSAPLHFLQKLSQTVWQDNREKKSVVFISSTAGIKPIPNGRNGSYATVKTAERAFVAYAAHDFARFGMCLNVLCPASLNKRAVV